MARLNLLILLIFFSTFLFAQDKDTTLSPKAVSNYTRSIKSKMASLDNQTSKGLNKWLGKLQKQENKLKDKVHSKDTVLSKQLFATSDKKYNDWKAKLNGTDTTQQLKEYNPEIDTLSTSLKYLEGKASPKELAEAKQLLKQYESKLQSANYVKTQLKQRQELLTNKLKGIGMVKDLPGWNKQAYYYNQQLNEYKSILKDRKKAEQKAIALLRETKLFKNFMQKNSKLSQLFGVPSNYGTAASLAGLQTRASVQNSLSQRLGSLSSAGGGMNAQQYLNSQMKSAQGELQKLKDKIKVPGGSSSGSEDCNKCCDKKFDGRN